MAITALGAFPTTKQPEMAMLAARKAATFGLEWICDLCHIDNLLNLRSKPIQLRSVTAADSIDIMQDMVVDVANYQQAPFDSDLDLDHLVQNTLDEVVIRYEKVQHSSGNFLIDQARLRYACMIQLCEQYAENPLLGRRSGQKSKDEAYKEVYRRTSSSGQCHPITYDRFKIQLEGAGRWYAIREKFGNAMLLLVSEVRVSGARLESRNVISSIIFQQVLEQVDEVNSLAVKLAKILTDYGIMEGIIEASSTQQQLRLGLVSEDQVKKALKKYNSDKDDRFMMALMEPITRPMQPIDGN